MVPVPVTERVRVAVIGDSSAAQEWASGFSGAEFEVLPVADVPAMIAARPARAVVFASPSDAVDIAAEIASVPDAPPVTIFVGPPTEEHPEATLGQTLLRGKLEWEATFDAIVDPVVLVNAAGRVVRANRGFAGVLGRTLPEVHGQPYGALLGEPADEGDPIAQSLRDGAPRTREVRFANLPGVWQATVSPMSDDAQHAPRGLVLILKDTTLSRDAEERLMRASRLSDVGQLAGGVAHEINTPLASIALRAESLLKAAQDPALLEQPAFKNFPRYLKTIDEEIFRCKKIISALLEFSRTRPPEIRATDLNALAEKAVDLVAHQARQRQVRLSFEPTEGLPLVDADGGQLRQALLALVMNAMDATRAEGRIVVSTRREADGRVSLSVEDDGVGISPADREKLFTPFFTTKPVGQGTGLGLASAHGIVAAHKGEVLVTSEPGRGSRFSLVLPAQAPAARKELP